MTSPTRPRFSIVTICRNDIAGLTATWKSVHTQTLTDFEWIVVDGASNDGTTEWLVALNDDRVAWRSEPDAGIYDAMNSGIDRCGGQLVAFLNSGDRLAQPGTLEFVDRDQRLRGWEWAIGTMNIIAADGRVIDVNAQDHFRPWELRMGYRSIGHQAAYFSSELVRSLGHYRPEFGIEADQEFMIRALAVAPPAVLHEVMAEALAGGVSFDGRPEAFVLRAQEIREAHGTLLGGNRMLDHAATMTLRAEKIARNRLWRLRGGGLVP